jgi:hypothetical protein
LHPSSRRPQALKNAHKSCALPYHTPFAHYAVKSLEPRNCFTVSGHFYVQAQNNKLKFFCHSLRSAAIASKPAVALSHCDSGNRYCSTVIAATLTVVRQLLLLLRQHASTSTTTAAVSTHCGSSGSSGGSGDSAGKYFINNKSSAPLQLAALRGIHGVG